MKKTKEKRYFLIIVLVMTVMLLYKAEAAKASVLEYPEHITVEDYPVITGDMLRYYYQNNVQVCIDGEGYNIRLNGQDICNYENELHTQIDLQRTSKGMVFEINKGENLCGDFILEIEQYVGDKLYLYNDSKEKYELLEAKDSTGLAITQEGTYLLTERKDVNDAVKKTVFGSGVFLLVGMVVCYVGMKKRYWFW